MLHSQIYKSTAIATAVLHHNACAIDKRGSDLGSCKLNFLVTTIILLFWILLHTHNKNSSYTKWPGRLDEMLNPYFSMRDVGDFYTNVGTDLWLPLKQQQSPGFETSSLVTKIWVKLTKSLLSHSFRLKKEIRKFDKYS